MEGGNPRPDTELEYVERGEWLGLEQKVERGILFKDGLRRLGLSPVEYVLGDLRLELADVQKRTDLNRRGKKQMSLEAWLRAYLDPALTFEERYYVQGLCCTAFVLVKAEPAECRPALEWVAENAPSELPMARRHVLKRMLADNATRQRMIDLTRHLTERQAAQVIPLSARHIGRLRQKENKRMEVEAPTLVEDVAQLRLQQARLEARMAEVERQVGVLPPERVEAEVERLLEAILD
jgi:hypothetical protein